jgi:hypothetical protein
MSSWINTKMKRMDVFAIAIEIFFKAHTSVDRIHSREGSHEVYEFQRGAPGDKVRVTYRWNKHTWCVQVRRGGYKHAEERIAWIYEGVQDLFHDAVKDRETFEDPAFEPY